MLVVFEGRVVGVVAGAGVPAEMESEVECVLVEFVFVP